MDRLARVLIVEARFYEDIAEELVRGAVAVLNDNGVGFERLPVPGGFEIPAAVSMAIASNALFDGYLALGCVIRGETSHYDHICHAVARGLNQLAISHRAAIGFGVLTCDNREQAWARAAVDGGNKGADAARACLAMIAQRRRWATR